MENNNNNVWIGIIAVIIIAVVIFLVIKSKNTMNSSVYQNDNSGSVVEPESVQDVSGQSSVVSSTAISYADALVKYADRRIQLDSNCQAYPNEVTYKDNTGIMIDNRSDATRTVKIGTTFSVSPYSFRIVVLPNVYLQSKTILVDCDSSQNVATILVQE